MATIFSKVFGVPMFLLFAVLQIVGTSSAIAQDSLCAEVKIEIKQKLSLERQAFDAHMRITNGLDTSAIEGVGAVLHFEDDKGNEVIATSDPNNTSAHFFARIDSLSGIDSIEGGGRVNPKTTADIHWLIIPAQGTGGTEPGGKLYYIGATLTYTLLGQASSVEVTPDYVTVKPQPLLDLDYFLAGDVYADDPFTQETEQPIPFTLGVRINNVGGGLANKVAIESAQPRIVENKQGLLIDFKIIDSYVSDQPAGKTLLIDFGDIEPQSSKVGRWNMVTTLSGKFVEINASYTHADSLGGALTSLIRNINSYLLVHDVKVDLPGRDNIRDFLAKSGDVLRVYESDGGDFPVTDQSNRATLQSGSPGQLNFPATTGFAYAKVGDPFTGKRTPSGVKRSDGKLIPPENVWLSQIRDESNNWQYFINIFDVNTTGRYTFDFTSGTTGDIAGIVYHDANSNGQKDENEEGMGNVKVTLQGSDNEGASVSVAAYTTADGVYQFVSLKPGTYRLKVDDVDGYINGARTIGNAGGALSADENNLITDIVLTAGANVSGYGFAKRRPSSSTDEADLAMAMTADKTLVRADDTVIFTLVAGNSGPATATGVKVTGKLPQGLSLTNASATVGSYDAASGIWTIGSLDKGAAATLTLTAKVGTISESVTYTATIASVLVDPNPANNTAQVTLTSEEDDTPLSLSLRIPQEARVLALVSCPDAADEDDMACSEAKAAWMAAYFAGRGYSVQAVTTTEAFRTQLRTGKYNVYWINGGTEKLTDPLSDEIRMAVYRGDTLIVDGACDMESTEQNAVFDGVLGVTAGTSFDNGAVMIDEVMVAVAGEAMALTLNGAAALAHFDANAGSVSSVAIARHAYGAGAALSAGFDLIGTMQVPTSEAAIRAFLTETLSALTPEVPKTLVGHAYLPVVIDVTHNDEDAATASVSVALPTGVKFVDARPAPSTVTDDRVTWTLVLVAEDLQSLRLGIRVPADNTTLRLTANIAETDPEVTADLDIEVIHFDAARMGSVIAQIDGSVANEAAQTAQTAFAAADYSTAITELVKSDRALSAAATNALRLNLARWLQEAELLWQESPPTPTVPTSIVAVNGTPQTVKVDTVFAAPLQALVKDNNGFPMADVEVTFALPSSGASAVFASSGMSVTVTTDAQGIATSPMLTANETAGGYQVEASVVGVSEKALFDLTNETAIVTPVAASIIALNGAAQVATVNTVFAHSLRAQVLSADHQPVAGVFVAFALPTSGASALFANGQKSIVVVTDAQGIATSPILTANATAGHHGAVTSVDGVATAATFALINSAVPDGNHSVATNLLIVGGNTQITAVDTTFTQPLQVMALDAEHRPVPELDVTFTLPNNGSSARFANDVINVVVVTDERGIATSPMLTANAVAGNFTVAAKAGALQADFTLTNHETQMMPTRIIAAAGTPQTAMINTVFVEPLQALVLDANQQPLSGITVTFTLFASGASATFPGNAGTVMAATNENGVAVTPALVANGVVGNYHVVATVEGVAQNAVFALANSATPIIVGDSPTSVIAIGGTPQMTTVDAAFAQNLQAKVLDADGQPVANAAVTFTLPVTGASAVFIGVTGNTVTVSTNVGGIAASPVLVANAITGSYIVAARVNGVVTAADFSLANEAATVTPIVSSITIESGTSQISEVNTVFAAPLKTLVKDSAGLPMAGMAVTFVAPSSGASALFDNGRNALTVLTDENGIASTRALTANGLEGSYPIIAHVAGIAMTACFDLTNKAAVVAPVAGSIAVESGTPQSTPINTAFALPLKALVKDTHDAPMAGVEVTFTLPASGASAAFAGGNITVTTTTDAQGIAVSPILTANATTGSYQAQASIVGVATKALFELSNTSTLGHTAPNFNGTTATGSGTVSASVTGGGPDCAFDLDRTRTAKPSGLMMNLLGKYLMPHGVFEFALVGCDVGSTVTITTTWPNLKGVTGYMKYGPTPWLPRISIWYVPSHLRISGNSVSYTITDGELGDDDLARNGVIRDPGGPIIALSNAVPIPALGRMGQALLLLLLAFAAVSGYRRR